jgi:hypothetical protein
MEFIPAGDLEAHIEAGISETEAKLITSQLAEGLDD